ncbi:MAG: AraC family ligand binding domain-containing protein [Granulosicoccaceae bacterium]
MSYPIKDRPSFWRDPHLPYVELRKIDNGQHVSYAAHAHKWWSFGAIAKGRSTYLNGTNLYEVRAGTLVLMNPEQMHQCNPIPGEPWAYYMLYADPQWLAELQVDFKLLPAPVWQDFSIDKLEDTKLFDRFIALCETLQHPAADLLLKQSNLVSYLSDLLPVIRGDTTPQVQVHATAALNIQLAAAYIECHFRDNISLDDLCNVAQCSTGHLIRSFNKHYGFSPHAFMINKRIQFAQDELKRGVSIAQAALNAGFSDQAHFQRTFKKMVAATPRQYLQQRN